MPREVRTSVDTRQVLNPISRPKATEVVARPTDQLVTPALDPELLGLVQGLSSLNPALQQYAYASRFEQAKDNQKHMKAGVADAAMGRELKPGSPEYYKHGYMSQRGQVGAEQSGTEFLNRVATEFDKDTGDFDQFTREHFGKDTHGITDHSYMEGYNQVIPKYIESARASVLKYRQDTLVARTETDFMTRMSGAFSAYTNNGMPIPQEAVDSFRKEGKNFFGISGARFNDLRFTVLKSIGDTGNYEVYEALKKPGSDGVPPLYDTPEWRSKIDAAEIHSKNVNLQKSAQADKNTRQGREDALNEAMLPILTNPDKVAADVQFEELVKEGKHITDAESYFKWKKVLNSMGNEESSAQGKLIERDLLVGIYGGSVGQDKILKTQGITPGQQKSLLGTLRQVRNENRQLSLQEQQAQYSVIKSPRFKEADDYLEFHLKPVANMLDFDKTGYEYGMGQLAAAKRELFEAALTAKNPEELRDKSYGIVTDYKKRAKENADSSDRAAAARIRFPTAMSLQEARASGKVSDEEALVHLEYLKRKQAANAPR